MKRTYLLLIVLVVVSMLFVGCTPATNEPVDPSGEEAETPADDITIAFIPQVVGIPYFDAMEVGGVRAAEYFGGEFKMVGSTSGSAPEQVRIMENLITQGVSAIGVSPLDGESIKPVMEEALEEGIPVFTSDADAADSPRMVYVAQALDKDLGYTLMDRLVAQTGEQAQIAIISGDPTIQSMANWVNFMTERAEQEYPDVEIVDIRYTPGGSAEESIRQAEELMTLYPDLKGIVGVASTNIASVPQAVEAAGKAGEIAVIGFGSPNTVREYIKAGVIKEAILWDPEELGYLSYWAALQLIQGNEFEEVNNVPGLDQPIQYFAEDQVLLLGDPLVIDADNVDDFDF